MTAIFDILLETDELVILGPPVGIDVSVDIGAQGQRGSRFIVGSGDPNIPDVIPQGQDVLIGDIFINSSTASKYAWLYVYVQSPSSTSGGIWTPALKLQPPIYSANTSVIFNSGSANISVPLSNIVSDVTIVDKNKYSIQVTADKTNPVALSVTSKDVQGPNLIFTVKAIEYNGTSWVNLSGNITLQILISVV